MKKLVLCLLLLGLAACQREERDFAERKEHKLPDTVSVSPLHPGNPPITTLEESKYEQSAYDVAEGKRLYQWFNCTGCHFNGGGGIGPALMDDKWIYGSSIENIVKTIKEGRPNGMPSFGGLIPEKETWQLAAYVRALGGFVAKDVAPSRNDDLSASPAENRLPSPKPYNGKAP